eukprot:5903532-Pleurochrysis_carterae.AAC.1
MHAPFCEYPFDSAKSRYKLPSRVTSISRVTCRVTRHAFFSVPRRLKAENSLHGGLAWMMSGAGQPLMRPKLFISAQN